ncbi:hypothetical protein PAXRUDRAFT_162161 [Paxillus rubicundulus Ve08.2h10]|uniref:Uncharacterized protein n=1 Tax=Paxillus rubicundulus Ve08.2h10 TaxID=930991 RepID=A0A0D0C847_9AGAM|nr:hypothetical protein PAXRUDRAFT_162161 [Paxillus rubicundulus Ve08.2h10]
MSVTGLPIRHTGEQFQRSNDTISRYFHKMLIIFSSLLFYTNYIQHPTNEQIPAKIHDNSKFLPYFYNAVGVINSSHIHVSPPHSCTPITRTIKNQYHKTVFLPVISTSNFPIH